MQRVMQAIEHLASTDDPVLICGEPGTGRELVSRVLHCLGPRQPFGFISVHAQWAPAELAYDPHRCSARETLRAAHRGTLLIRDIGDVPIASQQRLFEELFRDTTPNSGQVGQESGSRSRATSSPKRRGQTELRGSRSSRAAHDIRLIATCDPELGLAAQGGVFHRELFDTLGAQTVQMPPLRERIEDISVLYDRFVRGYGREFGLGRITVSRRVHDRLIAYPWPGNVAELKSIARRSVVRSQGDRIEPGHLDAVLPLVAERTPLEDLSLEEVIKSKLVEFFRSVEGYPLRGLYDQVLARVERPLFELIMDRTGSNQVRAAEILGLNRNTLRRKLNERGLLVRTKARSRTKSKARSKTGRRAVKQASR